jgi:uroporphyrinogen-III synthase
MATVVQTAIDKQSATSDRPLSGLRIVVTRAEGRAGSLVERLRELGAEPLLYATISHAAPIDPVPLAAACTRLAEGAFDWVVFTSATAVEYLALQLNTQHSTLITDDSTLNISAVGTTTAAACREVLGIEPALVPERFTAETLAAAFGDLSGQRVLLPNADIARPELEQRLQERGALVERVIAYRTVPASGDSIDMAALLAAGSIDVLTFTSGSTARYFVERIGPGALADANRCLIACIGPSTAAVARNVGLVPTVVAEVSTEAGLIDAIVRAGGLPHAPIAS